MLDELLTQHLCFTAIRKIRAAAPTGEYYLQIDLDNICMKVMVLLL